MSRAAHNRAIALCAATIARIAERAGEVPSDSPVQRRRVVELLLYVAEEIATLALPSEAEARAGDSPPPT